MEETEKAREQAEKARDQAEQEGYDVGVAETEEALKAEVSGVCRNYCLQVWNEALNQVWNEAFNQAKVKTSSILRKAKNVYYPLVSEHLTRSALILMPPSRWQKWARPVQPRP